MPFELYDYQIEMVNNARRELGKGNKGVLLQSPPGSGKSVVIAEIARMTTEKGNRVMFLVHRKELVEQITETFTKSGVDLNLCTIMTVVKVANRLDDLEKPNLIITDETHHSKAKTYRKIYDYYADVPKLGFTATPWRMNGDGFEDIYSSMVEGKSVRWLIENNRLAPYVMYSISEIEADKLKKNSTGDFSNESIEDALKSTIFGNVVDTYVEKTDGQQAILYAHSIEYSEMFAKQFQERGIEAVHVDSNTPARERDEIMKGFKQGEIKVLCNVDLISEGFDVPDCSVVIMTRPTESLVLYMQQSMRCMRYKPGKKATILDHIGNHTRHFMPDTDRHWKLNGWDKRKKNKNTDEEAVADCPFCFAVISTAELKENGNRCPICGAQIEIKITRDTDKEIIDSELTVVDSFKITTDYSKNNLYRKYRSLNYNQLQTLEDFYIYAKIHGYKDNWPAFKMKRYKDRTGSINWSMFGKEIHPIKRKYSSIL